MFSDLFSKISGKFGQKRVEIWAKFWYAIFSQNTVRSNIYFFSSPVLMFAPESIHQMAQFPFKTKQNKTKQNKIRLLKGEAHPPQTPPVRSSKSFLNVKADSRLCMPIKKPISEHNEWAFIIRPNIILYRTISNDFAEKLVLKMKEKLCEERRFGVFETLKTQELLGALPPGPPPGHFPWTPPGALERAPGPHTVKTLRSLCSNWTQTIFVQHPAVTNPAHAHALRGDDCILIAHRP